MNIFQTHAGIVEDYANYISSLLNIADEDIKQHVEAELKQGMRERTIRDASYYNLRFLIFDELHTCRGRQGADVAMLIRRIRSQCLQNVIGIGTSAIMVSVGDTVTQRIQVAKIAKTLFGRTFSANQVVNEKLRRSLYFIAGIATH